MAPQLGPFSSDDIAGFLDEHGYTANPAGLIDHYSHDFTFESDSLAWLDINAIAVRRGNVVPDRHIRITFQSEYNGVFPQWKLKSVEEVAADLSSKALDRERDFPKISPAGRRNEITLSGASYGTSRSVSSPVVSSVSFLLKRSA